MSQGALFGSDDTPPVEELFFALMPPAPAAQALTRLALELRERHGLQGKPLDEDRFHLSLHGLGQYAGLPPDLVSRAREAAATVESAPVEVSLDQAMSYGNPRERHPIVLATLVPSAGLLELHRRLGRALAHAGLGRHLTRSLSPHVSLAYVHRVLPQEAVTPVAWTATEFTLVHSFPGLHRHTHLGRWPLRG
ncbi:MAG: 2'-5' RNA ligase [Aquabacterium sp.]|nr:MAG: 2'-5' RNA ligase [Aquabacterium sp.]